MNSVSESTKYYAIFSCAVNTSGNGLLALHQPTPGQAAVNVGAADLSFKSQDQQWTINGTVGTGNINIYNRKSGDILSANSENAVFMQSSSVGQNSWNTWVQYSGTGGTPAGTLSIEASQGQNLALGDTVSAVPPNSGVELDNANARNWCSWTIMPIPNAG
jgi:hypothetical protein